MTGEDRGPSPAPQDATQKGPTSPVFERLPQLLNTEKLADLTLVAACGRRLPCHRVVLAASSERLERLVTEEAGSEISFPDVDGGTLDTVLRFLYSSDYSLTMDNAVAVLSAAQKYGVSCLEDLATRVLADGLTVQECCRMYVRLETAGVEAMKKQCLELAAERWESVYQTEGFLNLTLEQLKEMLKTPELLACHEVDLFKAACSWVLRDIQRVDNLEEILVHANFPRMSFQELRCVKDLLCVKYEQAVGAPHWPAGREQETAPAIEKSVPSAGETPGEVQSAGETPGEVQSPGASAGLEGKSGETEVGPRQQPLHIMPQVENIMGMLPIVLSLQAGQFGGGQIQRSSDVFSLPLNSTEQIQQLQELMMAQLAQQGQLVGMPMGEPTAGKETQTGQDVDMKDAAAGEAASQNSENHAAQECLEGVAETEEDQAMGESIPKKESSLHVKDSQVRLEVPQLITRGHGSAVGARNPRCMCQVEGCNNNLTGLRDYHVRYKICDYHLKVTSIIKDGQAQRFCQQCGRFHNLPEFDGNKRSCRARLMRHNARRRKRLRIDADCLQGAGMAVPVVQQHPPLICLVSTTPGAAMGGNLDVPATALAGARVSHDYMSAFQPVNHALTLGRGSPLSGGGLLGEKIASPVACVMEQDVGDGGVGRTGGRKSDLNNVSLLVAKDATQEEKLRLDLQGVVR